MHQLERSTKRRYIPWIICGFAGLFYFYQYLLRIMPSVFTPQLMNTFHLNPVSFANLTSIYYYIYIPMQLVVGVLLDRFGPRRLLTLALTICALGAYLFSNSYVLWLSLIGRLLVGLGSAFAFVGVLKIASMWLPQNRFSLITGLTTSLGMLGGLLSDVLLIKLVGHHGWRLTNSWIAISGLMLALVIFFLTKRSYQLDKERAEHYLPNIRSACAGLWQLFKDRQILINSIIGCLLYIPISGFADTWGISYLMAVDRLPKSIAAAAIAMIFLGWVCGAPIFGWVSDKMKTRRLPLTIGATVAAILLSIIIYVPDLKIQTIFILLFIFGFFSSAQVIVFAISRDLSPNALMATSAGVTNMIVMFAGVSISIIGFFLNISEGMPIHSYFSIYSWDFQFALFILPMSLTAAVFLTFYLQETYGNPLRERSSRDHFNRVTHQAP